jgi:hypothetical protein
MSSIEGGGELEGGGGGKPQTRSFWMEQERSNRWRREKEAILGLVHIVQINKQLSTKQSSSKSFILLTRLLHMEYKYLGCG